MRGLSERDTIPGRLLCNNYQVAGSIGHGAVSDVYLARQMSLGNRSVAVKVLKKVICASSRRSAAVHVKHFALEAELLHLCKSTAFAAIHDYGTLEDGDVKRPFMVMEYLGGALLSKYFEQGRQFPLPLAARIILTIGEALGELHRYKVTYRDLSPANVMLEEAGPYRLSPRLFDLSHAMRDGDDEDRQRSAVGKLLAGTPLYAAPELAQGPGSASADVYSLAALCYALMAGRPHIKLTSNTWEEYSAAMDKVKTLPEVPLRKLHKNLPRALDVLIEDCLSPNPESRVQTMAGFISRFALIVLDSSLVEGDPNDASMSGALVRALLGK
jgi:eukaryotic-like serine/threonine-protein kinase